MENQNGMNQNGMDQVEESQVEKSGERAAASDEAVRVTDVPPVILAVNTSSPQIDLAITRGDITLSTLTASRVEQHSRTLFTHLTALLDQAALTIDEVDLFAVVTGPGSFTGLRVGMSAVKGLAATNRRPIYGVDLLELKIRGLLQVATALVVCDSGRGEVFCGLRQLHSDGRCVSLHQDCFGAPAISLRQALTDNPPRNLLITGNGVGRAAVELQSIAEDHGISFLPDMTNLTRGANLAGIAGLPTDPRGAGWQIAPDPEPIAITLARTVHLIVRSKSWGRGAVCQPFYIRPSDAELNWKR
jgi:tRNA threonylcarbamoyl adenosine modification protein YeaZ